MGALKLTKMRRETLEQVKREASAYAEYYPPIKWLLENGLVRKVEGKYRDRIEITELGEKVLAEIPA